MSRASSTPSRILREGMRRTAWCDRRRSARLDPSGNPIIWTDRMTNAEETLSYETASARLEAIIARLDSGEAGLRETLDLCREGRSLVEFCAAELEAVGQGLEELRLDELVARLEAA